MPRIGDPPHHEIVDKPAEMAEEKEEEESEDKPKTETETKPKEEPPKKDDDLKKTDKDGKATVHEPKKSLSQRNFFGALLSQVNSHDEGGSAGPIPPPEKVVVL